MSRRRRKNDTEVTLLPFLAVLVCTMGALIVLLVVVMQQAQVEGSSTPPSQIAQSQPEPATLAMPDVPVDGDFEMPELVIDTPEPTTAPVQPLVIEPLVVEQPIIKQPTAEPPPIVGPSSEEVAAAQLERDNYLWEIKTLSESQQQFQQQLSGKALQLNDIDGETQRLISELQQLQQTVDDASSNFAASTAPATNAEDLAKLHEEIAAKQSDLAALQAKVAENQKTRYELVPYNGTKGTTRSPNLCRVPRERSRPTTRRHHADGRGLCARRRRSQSACRDAPSNSRVLDTNRYRCEPR